MGQIINLIKSDGLGIKFNYSLTQNSRLFEVFTLGLLTVMLEIIAI